MASVTLFKLALFAWFGLATATALLCAFLYPLMRRHFLSLPPATRGNSLLAWAVAPTGLGLLLTGFVFLPPVLSHFGITPGHCHPNATGLSPLCLLHPLAPMERELPWVILLPINGLGLVLLARLARKFLRLRRLARALTATSRPGISRDLRVVESERPLAMTAGLSRPRVFVSSKLADSLSPSQWAVVIAHERGHLRRRDPGRYFIAQALSCLHVPRLRRQLLADLSLAAEQACDEETATEVGDRLEVAETIVQVERLFHNPSASALPPLPSFMGNQVVARVESLLAGPQKRPATPRMRRYAYMGWVVAALLLLAEPLHQLTEAVLGLLIG